MDKKSIEVGFLEAAPGNKSNSRRIAWFAFWAGLVLAQEIILAGLYAFLSAEAHPDSTLIGIASAGAAIFTAIAGSAMAFTFFQKGHEAKQ